MNLVHKNNRDFALPMQNPDYHLINIHKIAFRFHIRVKTIKVQLFYHHRNLLFNIA